MSFVVLVLRIVPFPSFFFGVGGSRLVCYMDQYDTFIYLVCFLYAM